MSQTPNILCIVSDHQIHVTDPALAGLFPLQTALAERGVRFERAYSVLPICSPARASMLTGLYPHAHGLTENDGRFGGREGLDASDWMVQQSLLDAGYRCAWFGKWHVDNYQSAQDYGFEGFSLPGYGYPYGTDEYREYLHRNGLERPVATVEIAGESAVGPGERIDFCAASNWFAYEAGSAILEGPAETHEAFFVADLAARWLDSLDDEPFFLRVDTWGPHPPYIVAEPYLDRIADLDPGLPENFITDLSHRPGHHRDYRDFWQSRLQLDTAGWRKMYYRALEQAVMVESALAGLLDKVDWDNTLVLFTSDHGDAVGSNGGVANKGGLMVEATMHISMLLAGAELPAGETRRQLVSNLDLAPTLLDACGLGSPDGLHGESLMPIARRAAEPLRAGLMTEHYGLHVPVAQRAWYRDDYKLVVQEDGFCELYDLSRDPGELSNLAKDPSHAVQRDAMRRELRQAMLGFGDDEARLEKVLAC